jgi:RNA recognition motif-containing protein
MNIIVLNLSRKTTAADLIELFKFYGPVESCNIVMDQQTGESKGFGFVKMTGDDESEAAILRLHGTKVDGYKIRVKASDKTK